MPSISHHVIGLGRAVGWPAALDILARRVLHIGAELKPKLRNSEDRVSIRPLDSDLFVASQIFGWNEYALPSAVEDGLNRLARQWRAAGQTPLVVDAGANVGYSALAFSKTFPEALVLAVEPDRETFDVMVRNCRHRPNIRPVHAALWSHDRGVHLQGAPQGSWAARVGDEGAVTPSMTLDALVGQVEGGRVLVLKLDIEGAENTVCSSCPGQFASAPCILIEPHDFMLPGASSLSPLYAALNGRQVDTLISGENLILVDSELCLRPNPTGSPPSALPA